MRFEAPAMKTYMLLLLLAFGFFSTEVFAQAKKSRKPTKKVMKKPASASVPVTEEVLLGKITTGKMTIKVHRMIEVFLSPCEKCIGSDQNYKPKPQHRVLLFEISRRNPNSYELNAQIENTTPLYARIVGTDNREYPCYTLPSLIEIAMAQKKGITSQNGKMYFQLLGSAPPRTEHRAFALAVEMPLDVQPKELIWQKDLQLKCPLNMQNNKLVHPTQVVAEKPKAPASTSSFTLAQ